MTLHRRWIIALASAVAACGTTTTAGPPLAPPGRINIDTEQVTFDAPLGWDVRISFPRTKAANAVIWLSPPAAHHGLGRIVLLAVFDAVGRTDDDLTRWLTDFVAHGVHDTPAPVQRIDVPGAQVSCVEHVGPVEVTVACGLYRATTNSPHAQAWGFLQGVDVAFYREVGGAAFLAGLVASLREFAVMPSNWEPITPQ